MHWLAELSGLITRGVPPEEIVREALPVLRDGLRAGDAFLVYGQVGGFSRYGTSDLELDDAALWLCIATSRLERGRVHSLFATGR